MLHKIIHSSVDASLPNYITYRKGIPGAVTLNLYSRTQPSMLTSIVSFLPQFDYGTSYLEML